VRIQPVQVLQNRAQCASIRALADSSGAHGHPDARDEALIPLPARFVVRWRWPIVAAWVVFTALFIPLANDVHHALQVGGQEMPDAESTRAEMIVRTYHESQDKPTYLVRERINIDHESDGLRNV